MKKCRGGFTLIELLVVIAIIALLVSLLVPSLFRAKEIAKHVVCSHSEKGQYVAMLSYSEDHVGWLPPNCGPNSAGNMPWYGYLLPNPTLVTPSGWKPLKNYATTMDIFKCPNQKKFDAAGKDLVFYGLNFAMAGQEPQQSSPWMGRVDPADTVYQYNLQKTVKPSAMYLAGESTDGRYFTDTDWGYITFPHLDKCNLSYMDGRQQAVRSADVPLLAYWQLPWFNRAD